MHTLGGQLQNASESHEEQLQVSSWPMPTARPPAGVQVQRPPNTDLGNAFRAAQVSWAPALCLPFESFGWGGQP